MLSLTTFVVSLLSVSTVSATQHAGSDHHNRRGLHRMIQRTSPVGSCDEGQWQCDGTKLQQCASNVWVTIQDCTGQDMVCSAAWNSTGCVWTWDISSVAISPSVSSWAPTESYSESTDQWDSTSTTEGFGSSSAPTDTAWSSSSSTSWDVGVSSTSSSAFVSSTEDWSRPTSTDSAASDSTYATESWDQTSSSASATSAPSPVETDGGGSTSRWNAPHYVIYSDYWLHVMPAAWQLIDFNRFILAFWMADRGAVDNAQMWEWKSPEERQQILDEYHAAGIALMVSAFGSTDAPVSNGVDPTDCAQRLAAWVKQYNLDGVDIDWEDMHAMNTGSGEAWLITFQLELRRQLPAGEYLISHAPVAPWFTSAPIYPDGAYVAVHKQAGEGIDFYNMQFYNQGDIYMDCQTLLWDSGPDWPSSSVFEMRSYAGIPLDKIVIGKPINAGAATNGYMDPSSLSTCVKQAEAAGWNGGVMYWEWNAETPGIMATTLGKA